MKKMTSKFAVLSLMAVLAGCNGQPNFQSTTKSDSTAATTDVATEAAAPSIGQDSIQAIMMIKDLYDNYVFGKTLFDKKAAERFCTKSLTDKLNGDFDPDGEEQAVWIFRLETNDGAKGDGLKCITKTEEKVFVASFVDNGIEADANIRFAKENGQLLIDEVEVKSSVCLECKGTKLVTCPTCAGEGFIYTPNETQGEDWGRACFDCNGRGYGHRNGNESTLKLGTGKVPCFFCVKEIMVDVPQSTNETCLNKVPEDLEKKLVGNHGVRLQWISDTKLGSVSIAKESDGLYSVSGGQQGSDDDYLRLDGKIRVVNVNHLIFDGTIDCHISHIHKGKPYIRKGTMDFVNKNGGRKFWRLQQMDNGDCTDYIDIYL